MKKNIIPTRSGSSPKKRKHIRCVVCGEKLEGKQTKFCSAICKSRDSNNKHQCYAAQKARAKDRKLQLVQLLGGRCARCGYKKNLAAMCFHHKGGKDLTLDARSLSNRKWKRIEEEVLKCELLCHNCHMEEHYPDLALPSM